MREGFKKNHVNLASRIMAFFMQGIWARQALLAKQHPLRTYGSRNRSGYLPKGFKDHNPAGSKVAKLAREHRCTLRHV